MERTVMGRFQREGVAGGSLKISEEPRRLHVDSSLRQKLAECAAPIPDIIASVCRLLWGLAMLLLGPRPPANVSGMTRREFVQIGRIVRAGTVARRSVAAAGLHRL